MGQEQVEEQVDEQVVEQVLLRGSDCWDLMGQEQVEEQVTEQVEWQAEQVDWIKSNDFS